MMFVLAVFTFTFDVINCNSNNLVNYYVDLINRETEMAFQTSIALNAYEYTPNTKQFKDYGVFDHIIIGAGTAGAVIANRLSEDIAKKILVLEAGGSQSNFSNIPAMGFYLQGPEYRWNYYSSKQSTSCLGMIQKQCYYLRGKGLGGTTALNGLLYSRGFRKDYDNWYAQGNVGWSYKDMLPYFEKLETEGNDNCQKNQNFRLEFQEPISPQTKEFFKANQEVGLKFVKYNNDNHSGMFRPIFTKFKGQRLSTGRAFLEPIQHRKNLNILTNAFVVKILVNKRKKAYGVIFTKNNNLYIAKSRNDIILSAGVFGSPQILMLSGVGPRYHLEYLGIPVVEELPVGNNFEDHVTYAGLEFLSNYTEPFKTLEEKVEDYLNNSGPLTSAWNAQALAFIQSQHSKLSDYPDVELFFIASNNSNDISLESFNFNFRTFRVISRNREPQRSFTVFVVVLRPKSNGYFRLNSVNPFDYPKIDPRLLSDPDDADIDTLYNGIQYVLKLLNTTAFASMDAKLKDKTLRECRRYTYFSKQYWYCQIRQLSTSFFHPVGTCKMGLDPSRGAVVDPELRVYGIKNLRIGDTSVFPSQISAHPMATAIVVGEKLSDMIKRSSRFKGY
ncbi:hypothetical protein FQR65_LT08162 [Abscondita terminalis]|nr:hypothetical protein FQR65_LT08162 [Abscondita terminalis]